MIRIYADFNSQYEDGRFWMLGIPAKYADTLTEGMTVMLYMDNEFEVEATLIVDDRHWTAIPNYETLHYLDEED